MTNFVQRRKLFFTITGILILLSVAALITSAMLFQGQALRISTDFTGGTLFVLHFEKPVHESDIRSVFADHDQTGAIVQQLGTVGDNTWQVRARFTQADEVEQILADLETRVGNIDRQLSNWSIVEPTVGAEVAKQAICYGVVTIVAMLVNVVISLGFYALMGILNGWEADALFLTAMLTVIGFSVQDLIVVFDRIRENIRRHHRDSFEMIVNRSVAETVVRSLATQLNAMFVMVAILLFGGVTIKPFIAVMLVGMISETYTSLCVAVPLLVIWEEHGHHTRRATT
jgi:preprotein translocase subunit SecF